MLLSTFKNHLTEYYLVSKWALKKANVEEYLRFFFVKIENRATHGNETWLTKVEHKVKLGRIEMIMTRKKKKKNAELSSKSYWD